jgi:hypothetical protein
MQCAAIAQWNPYHVAFRTFGCLANGFRHLAGFTRTKASPSFAISDNDKCGETKPPPTFDHLGHTIDANQLFEQFWLITFYATIPTFVIACH